MPRLSTSESTSPPPTITLAGCTIRIAPDRAEREAFWRNAEKTGWEVSTLRFVHDTTDNDTTFIDIGAWIGPVSLVASSRAKRVIAIEPDPVAASELEEMIALNGAPIEVWRAGIDGAAGSLRLFAKTGFGDTMTSSLGDPSAAAIDVAAVSFGDISAALVGTNGKVVVKMDVEGHEFVVGEQLADFVRRHRAPTNLSLHAGILHHARRREMGPLRARWQTFLALKELIGRLAAVGRVTVSKTGRPMHLLRLMSFVFLRRWPKNFSIDVVPGATPSGAPEAGL